MERIAILVNSLRKGGAEKQAMILASALEESADVRVVVLRPDEGVETELLEMYGGDPGDIIMMRSSIAGLYRWIRAWKPTVMFCYLTYANFIGAVIGRIAGVKRIYQGLRNSHMPFHKLVAEYIANKISTGAVVNSHAGYDYFSRHGFNQIHVIPNCYPSLCAVKTRGEKRLVMIATIARFVPQKDYSTAIYAIKNVRSQGIDVVYRIIGYGPLEADIRELVRNEELDDCIEIMINPPNVISLVDEADIYLSTSLWEGTSNSIMEAMDISLPVVATDVGDNAHLIENGVTGYITAPRDIDNIAAHLIELAGSSELRNEMGARGNARLRDHYGLAPFTGKYLSLLPGVITP